MNFKPGDKVTFLNEKGGGIITRIGKDDIVYVTIEDGFEIPVMARELIKSGISEDTPLPARKSEVAEQETDEDMLPLYVSYNNPEQTPQGLYFCFVPDIQDSPLTGSLEVHLLNHTPYQSLFGLFLSHSGSYHGTEYGFLEPESRLHLATIGRSEIEKWANALWQSVFYQEGKCQPVPPFSGLISFKPIKLYKEESFQFESLLRKKVFLVEVCKLADLSQKELEKTSKENTILLKEKIRESQASAPAKPSRPQTFLDKHKIDDKIAEVDLHIGELVENFHNLEKNDLLNIQLDYFRKCMRQAEKEKLSKIIFIHGIGNGKLKTEIHNILNKTQAIEFYDASYARYGMGATEVKFYRHK